MDKVVASYNWSFWFDLSDLLFQSIIKHIKEIKQYKKRWKLMLSSVSDWGLYRLDSGFNDIYIGWSYNSCIPQLQN